MSHGYAKKIHREQLRTGQMERQPQSRYGRASRVTAIVEDQLRAEVKKQPDVTLWELEQRMRVNSRVQLSPNRWGAVLQRLGLQRKKNSPLSGLDPTCLVFVDESGATTNMTRGYGRAPRGQRVQEAGRWQTLTLLGAMSCSGLIATMTIPEPTDGDIFLAYVEQVLCPRLQPGRVVIMDNLAAHKVARVHELIASAGASLVYLPPTHLI